MMQARGEARQALTRARTKGARSSAARVTLLESCAMAAAPWPSGPGCNFSRPRALSRLRESRGRISKLPNTPCAMTGGEVAAAGTSPRQRALVNQERLSVAATRCYRRAPLYLAAFAGQAEFTAERALPFDR